MKKNKIACLILLLVNLFNACQKNEHLSKDFSSPSPSYYGITVGPDKIPHVFPFVPSFINSVLDRFDNDNLTHVIVYPVGYINRNQDASSLIIRNDSTDLVYQGQKTNGIISRIQEIHARNFKTVLKPHLYVSDGTYTGKFKPDNASDWPILESNYAAYIHHYARIADAMQVDFFCVGTEVDEFVIQRPDFWEGLIDSIRTYYNGKIIYAANWDRYEKLSIWNHTDYIGIDAYFPLSDAELPSTESLCESWEQNHLFKLKKVSENYNKKIIFTEIGYRSVDYCAKEPWDYWNYPALYLQPNAPNDLYQQNQANAIQAALAVFEHSDFIDGFFYWEATLGNSKYSVDYDVINKIADTLLTNSFRRIKNK